jgi:hypothetical protein
MADKFEINMNYANPQEHVPDAKRNNRVITKRFQTSFHRLPYQKIPKIMIKMLTMDCAKKLNFFPLKGSVSAYYSPRTILYQKSLDYKKHCSIPFGSYAQTHTEPEPRNTPGEYSLS